MFKFKNFNQVRTTVLAIAGGLLIVAGIIWPDKATDANSEAITVALDQILVGIGGLIETLALMFGAKDG